MQINQLIKLVALCLGVVFTLNSIGVGATARNGNQPNSFALAANPSGFVVSARLTRVGSDFQISWTITGDVSTVKIKEGTNPEQIENLVAEVNGITSTTISGLDLTQRHYFLVTGGSDDGVIAAERAVPQINLLNF